MREIEALLEKADRSLVAARRLLEEGDADFAVSRAYYGYFYVAEALLLSEGLRFSRHAQVVAQYGRHFARTDVLDRRFHRFLTDAFALRQVADYTAQAQVDPGEVRRLIEEGHSFLDAACEYLATREGGPST